MTDVDDGWDGGEKKKKKRREKKTERGKEKGDEELIDGTRSGLSLSLDRHKSQLHPTKPSFLYVSSFYSLEFYLSLKSLALFEFAVRLLDPCAYYPDISGEMLL